jgi:hypothetical protein
MRFCLWVLSVPSIKLWVFDSNKGSAISFQLLIVLLFGTIIVWASGSVIDIDIDILFNVP